MLLKIDKQYLWENRPGTCPAIHFVKEDGTHFSGYNIIQISINCILKANGIFSPNGLDLDDNSGVNVK